MKEKFPKIDILIKNNWFIKFLVFKIQSFIILSSDFEEYLYQIKLISMSLKKEIVISFFKLCSFSPILGIWLSENPRIVLKIFEISIIRIISNFFHINIKFFDLIVIVKDFPLIEDLLRINKQHLNLLVKTSGIVKHVSSSIQNSKNKFLFKMISNEYFGNFKKTIKDKRSLLDNRSPNRFCIIGKPLVSLYSITKEYCIYYKNASINRPEINCYIIVTGIFELNEFCMVGNIKNMFSLEFFFESISIVSSNQELAQRSSLGLHHSQIDANIYTIAKKSLVYSFCPSVKGYMYTKKCILVSLLDDFSYNNTLIKPLNVLIIGESQTGKTQLLNFVNLIDPSYIHTYRIVPSRYEAKFHTGKLLEQSTSINNSSVYKCISKFDKLLIDDIEETKLNYLKKVKLAKKFHLFEYKVIEFINFNIVKKNIKLIASTTTKYKYYDDSKPLELNIKTPINILDSFDLVCIQKFQKDISLINSSICKTLKLRYLFNATLNEKRSVDSLKQLIVFDTKSNKIFSPVILKHYLSFSRKYIKPMFTKGNLKLIIKVIQKINNALEIDKLTKNRGKSIESLIRISSSRARLKNKISIDFSDLLYSLIIILKNNLSKKSLSHQKYVYKKLFEYFKDPEINSCLLENIIDEYFINELYQKIDYKFSVNNSNYCVSNMIKERDYNSLDFYNSTCLSSLIKRKRLIKLLANKYHIDIK